MARHIGSRKSVATAGRALAALVAMMQVWRRRTTALMRAQHGNAALEFALASPILIGLLTPVADLGLAFSEQIKVNQAAQAGAEYASLHPWTNSSVTSISSAVTGATALSSISASPAPSQTCGCPTGSAIASATCGSTCSSGAPAGYYVTVSAQAPYTSQFPYSLLGSTVTLTAQSIVRVR